MLRSMTGFGRSVHEEEGSVQTWEVRSVNGRHLDIKWRLPTQARSFESQFEKVVRRFANRGRVEISLQLQSQGPQQAPVNFDAAQASAMLNALENLAAERNEDYAPDYNRLLGISFLWGNTLNDAEDEQNLGASLEQGLAAALEDWNEARATEGHSLAADLQSRFARMAEWVNVIEQQTVGIKEERFTQVRERLNEVLEALGSELDDSRFLQEMVILSDRLDVSEELTRLRSHLERLDDLLNVGVDAGRKVDFTLQECFREINTCGNKLQNAQLSRLIVDFKNELEKCREQVQNLE